MPALGFIFLLLILAPAVATAHPLSLRDVMHSAVRHHPTVELAMADAHWAAGLFFERDALMLPRLTYDVVGESTWRLSSNPFETQTGIVRENLLTLRSGVEGLTPFGGTYSVSLAATGSNSDSLSTTLGTAYRISPALTFRQPLLRGLGRAPTMALLDAARFERAAADVSVREAMLTAAASAAERYWNWSFELAGVRIVEVSLEQAREALRQTQLKAKAGAISPLEVAQAEATFAERENELLLAQRKVLLAERELLTAAYLHRTSLPWKDSLSPSDTPVDSAGDIDMDALIEGALKSRPEIKRAQERVRAQEHLVAMARDSLRTRLDVIGTVGMTGLGGTPGSAATLPSELLTGGVSSAVTNLPRGPFFAVGISGDLPLDRAADRGRLEQALAELSRRRAELEEQKALVVLDVRTSVLQVKADLERIGVTRNAERLAAANFEAEQKKFAGGVSTTFDVLRVQSELARARTNAFQAVVNLNVSLIRLRRAEGNLLEAFALLEQPSTGQVTAAATDP